MNEVIKFPGKDRTATKPIEIKVGNDQPSPSDTIIRGQKAQARLEEGSGQVWSDWCDLIRALACQNRALREAERNKPQGPNYRRAIGRLLRCHGFDRIDKGDRSRLIGYAANLAAIDKWRAGQPNERQLDLNHPRVVAAGWKRSLWPKPQRSPSSETELDHGYRGARGYHHHRSVGLACAGIAGGQAEDRRRARRRHQGDEEASAVEGAPAQGNVQADLQSGHGIADCQRRPARSLNSCVARSGLGEGRERRLFVGVAMREFTSTRRHHRHFRRCR